MAYILERLQRGWQNEVLAWIARRPPCRWNRAIRHIEESHPNWCRRSAGGRDRMQRAQGLERRQRQTRSQSAQEVTAAQAGCALGGDGAVEHGIRVHGEAISLADSTGVAWAAA